MSCTFRTCVHFLFPVNNYKYSYSAEYCSELFNVRSNTEKPIFGTALMESTEKYHIMLHFLLSVMLTKLLLLLHYAFYGRPVGQAIIFCSCGFCLSSFFFSSPILSGRRLDVYHTSTHDMALVQIQNAGLKCAACCSLKNTGCKKLPSAHHCTTLSGYIFTAKACIDNQLKTC